MTKLQEYYAKQFEICESIRVLEQAGLPTEIEYKALRKINQLIAIERS